LKYELGSSISVEIAESNNTKISPRVARETELKRVVDEASNLHLAVVGSNNNFLPTVPIAVNSSFGLGHRVIRRGGRKQCDRQHRRAKSL
jgi:hypothetical protein